MPYKNLIEAAYCGNPNDITELLEKGASVNDRAELQLLNAPFSFNWAGVLEDAPNIDRLTLTPILAAIVAAKPANLELLLRNTNYEQLWAYSDVFIYSSYTPNDKSINGQATTKIRQSKAQPPLDYVNAFYLAQLASNHSAQLLYLLIMRAIDFLDPSKFSGFSFGALKKIICPAIHNKLFFPEQIANIARSLQGRHRDAVFFDIVNGKNITQMRIFLENGADVNVISENGTRNSALHQLIGINPCIEAFQLFLDYGVNISYSDNNSNTAIDYAILEHKRFLQANREYAKDRRQILADQAKVLKASEVAGIGDQVPSLVTDKYALCCGLFSWQRKRDVAKQEVVTALPVATVSKNSQSGLVLI